MPSLRTLAARLSTAASLFTCSLLSVSGACAATNPDWTTPVPPFRIADNLYYVGTRDLAAYLITTPQGNILLNANLPSSPPLIRHSVEQLGFPWRDIKLLLISHAHVDHAGGAAEILRETGATLDVMAGDDDVMQSGGATDFAFGHTGKLQFPRVHVDHVLHDNEAVTLGGVTLVAHRTAGHTRSCTTWTTDVHLPGDPATVRRHVVIGGSWTVLSEYRLVPQRGLPASYPGIATDFAHTFAVLHQLPCDLFLASHGSAFDLLHKLQRLPAEGPKIWLDPQGYARAVDAAQRAFEADLQRQTLAAAPRASKP